MTKDGGPDNRQLLAQKCAALLMERDEATRQLGASIHSVAPGSAVLSMPVAKHMVQGHGNCHGGYIFALADSAFAFGCNTYNAVTVGQSCNIDYISPAKLGDILTATCLEISRGKTTGVYDVKIENQDGKLIALFRGNSYQVGATLF